MDSESRKREIADELARVRARTLSLLEQVPEPFWNVRIHDFYSPIGWHFGHIGMTEELWTCGRALGRPPGDERLCFLFANIPENPKDNRVHLPSRSEVEAYLCATRARSLDALGAACLETDDPLLADGYAWEFALQHECQHQETIAEVLQLIRKHESSGHADNIDGSGGQIAFAGPCETSAASGCGPPERDAPMVHIAGGTFVMGSDERHGYDNEKRAHSVEVASFELDAHAVTSADWLRFIAAECYEDRACWSDAGWEWRNRESVTHPEYWLPTAGGWRYCSVDGLRELDPMEPAASISWYEADAYARWVGKRLPTEAEWEFAAACYPALRRAQGCPRGDDPAGDLFADGETRAWAARAAGRRVVGGDGSGALQIGGGAWEWTSSAFLPYPGFAAFPYDGYSREHMDGSHYVCRGGSWATDRRILRASFRNWYVPTYRQGFLGMRCAR